jgi:nuclear transport factor 2 (NTF2) superfamily protein
MTFGDDSTVFIIDDGETVRASIKGLLKWCEFLCGREKIKAFLRSKWAKELDYRSKTLWGFRETRIAVSFEYEWHDEQGQWYRPYGSELWGSRRAG